MTNNIKVTKCWTIPASFNSVQPVCDEITAVLIQAGLINEVFPVSVLTHEALNNAILHGCLQEITKKVNCEMTIAEGVLHLVVTDEGLGFDWRTAIEKDMASEDQESGRGLWLYRLYADTVEFNPQGNRVRLLRILRAKNNQNGSQ